MKVSLTLARRMTHAWIFETSGIRDSGFWFRVLGFDFWVLGFGFMLCKLSGSGP
ncbi:hypothetical protein T484DRAFT_1982313 [Baffinella frigidus]|nr:hypothetical protein T484DRAFT_1982313 [Cryptophyta sp. CCMP2293]